jgi:hypothetical protein
LPQVDAVTAHRNALFAQEVALSLSRREGSVGMDHAVPWKTFASGGENTTDEARRFRVDVAVGADKSHGNRADPTQDRFCAWIEALALHAKERLAPPTAASDPTARRHPYGPQALTTLLVEVLQEVVGGQLDLFVTPLGSPVLTGDDAGAMDAPEVAEHERVSRLRIVRGAIGQP